MMSEASASSERFEDYLVFRIRLDELVQLQHVLEHLMECEELKKAPPKDAIQAQLLAIATHFAGFFDTRDDSLNVFDVWGKYFPTLAGEISAWREELAPAIKKLRALRNKAGAHADTSIAKQNAARMDLAGAEMGSLVRRFYDIGNTVASAEESVAGLPEQIAAWGLRPAK